MNPFQSLPDYEEYVYSLWLRYRSVASSTLVIYRRGARIAVLKGEIHFHNGYRLVVHERLSLDSGTVLIDRYGYEVWQGQEKVYWYDPQPHPDVPELATTHPHHKHIPPDMKHHRIPAPGLSFVQPNLPFLIREVEQLL